MSVSSSSSDPVQAIFDLLDGFTGWTEPAPEVRKQWNWSPDQRENTKDPALYVWSPVEGSLEAFDAEYSHIDDTQTVEINIWTLDPDTVDSYANDVIQFLSEYGNDNESNTVFHRIRPNSVNDLRQEKIARKTDHYVITVTTELRFFRETGL